LIAATADGELPGWLQQIENASPAENAFYRWMDLPLGKVHFRRPPSESRPLLDELVSSHPSDAELLSLRAMNEEQQLDFEAAEKDWQAYSSATADHAAGLLALADFYHRRARPKDEIAALSALGTSPAAPSQKLLAPQQEQSWLAFARIFRVIAANALPDATADTQYRAWIARYPREASLYAGYFEFLLDEKNYIGGEELLASYEKGFPDDHIFPVKAQALLDYRRGDIAAGLAIYDKSFQPLWPPELIQGYFSLLQQTGNLRKFLDASRAAHAANPDDLNAIARLFYYYQQDGKPGAAQEALDEFRAHKESTRVPWTANELITIAGLYEKNSAYADAARCYVALYSTPAASEASTQKAGGAAETSGTRGNSGAPENRERALAALTRILLASPEQPLRLGAADLSLYKDIGTADPGPGFLNGILSLLFNSQDPRANFTGEESRGVAYFHRAEAAKLLAVLDAQFPNSPDRGALHVQLLQAYVAYGESEAVIRGGREFLAAFPDSPDRTNVSLLMADAYAGQGKPEEEFAIYDAALRELGQKAQNVPLGSADVVARALPPRAPFGRPTAFNQPERATDSSNRSEGSADSTTADDEDPAGEDIDVQDPRTSEYQRAQAAARRRNTPQAFQIAPSQPNGQRFGGARSAEYSNVLESYLSRLTTLNQLPRALQVLRREVDRNPNDPGLYERLAQFLEQNRLGAQEEEVYERAIQQFPDRSWYHKLARAYLRHRRDQELEQLTATVTKAFAGSELEDYFNDVVASGGAIGPQFYLNANLYAHRRFPHDLVFVRNLLSAYHTRGSADEGAYQQLLAEHWFEDASLRDEYFETLSRTRRLDPQLAELRGTSSGLDAEYWTATARRDPAAVEFVAEAELWQSHFEEAARPLGALAGEYPADFEIGRRASALYRSLAFFDPLNTDAAVNVENNLLSADPGNRDTLARIGDIYADRSLFSDAAPYWNHMTEIEPGTRDAFLEPATVFWDYFQFGDALRLLGAGRVKLGRPAEFAYEEGAIFENERDYPRAVEQYVRGTLADGENSDSWYRLERLVHRGKLRDAIDRGTAHVADGANPPLNAIRLRFLILQMEGRKPELRAFLLDALGRSDSLEVAEGIEGLAQNQSLEDVRQRALERQAALTSDPIRRLELRYSLVQFFESQKDYDSAQKNIEALYRENPKILGVVRATVDFYWRRKMRRQAIDVLLHAARDSYPGLRDPFNFEAARKATDAGDFALARQLLDPLLEQSPYNAEYLAAVADTYAQSGDSAGLRDFYLAKIALFRQAPLAPDDRVRRVAELRRGLIPALTQLKDYTGAVDQYIEIVNQFPEDAGLTGEAALYAQQHALALRLAAYYGKTGADSPRDYRWPMVLARIETQFEDYPAAIAAYTKAIAVRPDRTDLYVARADLRERLMKFDDAAADYTKLYALAYQDAKYMLKVAELAARERNADAAVAALKTAYIEGRPVNAQNFFDVARSLEAWDLLPQAAAFAEQGVDAAGADLLANPANHDGAALYARTLTRLRRQQEAYNRLQSAYDTSQAPVASLASTVAQVEKQGLAAVTDSGWREHERQQRSIAGDTGIAKCLNEMGTAVARYFTPEEKVSFSAFLTTKEKPDEAVPDYLIGAAQSAGLADLEARWRYAELMRDPENGSRNLQPLSQLQSQRLKFTELAGQLEKYASVVRMEARSAVLFSAANAYHSAGSEADELRIYLQLESMGRLYQNQQRFFELLYTQDRERLLGIAGEPRSSRAEAAVNFALATGDRRFAYDAIRAHGRSQMPVWTNAYSALAGLYFADSDEQIGDSFDEILDPRPIGERLQSKFDAQRQLSGNDWFYYGSRYGDYQDTTHKGDPEDYLPAILEQSPGAAASYLVTASYYADAKNLPLAAADYERSLELDPEQPGVRERLAMIFVAQGRSSEAIAEWKRAFAELERQEQRFTVPESFYLDFGVIVGHLREQKLLAAFRPQIDSLIRGYIRKNGDYNTMPLLRAVYATSGDSQASLRWLLDLASASPDEDAILRELIGERWFPESRREPIYRRRLELAQASLENLSGGEKEDALSRLRHLDLEWIDYLVETRQYQRAKGALDEIPAADREPLAAQFAALELRAAAGLHTLDALLAADRADPERAPSFQTLRDVAKVLNATGDKVSSRKILEFAYEREIGRRNLAATNFLGLAEIRIENGDARGAIALLDRLVLVVGAPFENLDAAAWLLERHNLPAEASVYLAQLSQAEPWRADIRLRLARFETAAGKNVANARKELVAIAASPDAAYGIRAAAASASPDRTAADKLGGGELALLAGGHAPSALQANQPYFTIARLKAASRPLPARDRIALLRATLEDAPWSEAARVQIVHAAAAAHDYQVAESAAAPLVDSQIFSRIATPRPELDNSLEGFPNSPDEVGPTDDAADGSAGDQTSSQDADSRDADDSLHPRSAQENSAAESAPEPDAPFWASIAGSDLGRLRLALDLADVYEHLDDLDRAVHFLQIAARLQPRHAARASYSKRFTRLQAEINRRADNAARRPVVHAALEQDRIVRPEIPALRAATPSKPVPPKAPSAEPPGESATERSEP
jgi:tetratricopeptide (TPR) repeat protein